jgi:hypothetical protein
MGVIIGCGNRYSYLRIVCSFCIEVQCCRYHLLVVEDVCGNEACRWSVYLKLGVILLSVHRSPH